MLKPSANEPRDYIIQVSVNIPNGHYSELLPFRITPEQMQSTTVTFEAVNTVRRRANNEMQDIVMDHMQTVYLKDLIGPGVSRTMLEQADEQRRNEIRQTKKQE